MTQIDLGFTIALIELTCVLNLKPSYSYAHKLKIYLQICDQTLLQSSQNSVKYTNLK